MSVPDLPSVEAPEEDDEEDVKVTAEEMASMTVSSRPHTQVGPANQNSQKSPFHLAIMAFLSQVDYIHHLVPDLAQITSCSFYWGKMDRYEAEALLEGKAEGSFLLRDSAQDEYLFSVSFRRYTL